MGFPRAGSNPAGCESFLHIFSFYFRNSDVPNRRASACGLDCPDYVNGSTWYRHKSFAPKPQESANKRYFSVRISSMNCPLDYLIVCNYRIKGMRRSLQSQSNTISHFRGHLRRKTSVISRSWSLKKNKNMSLLPGKIKDARDLPI